MPALPFLSSPSCMDCTRGENLGTGLLEVNPGQRVEARGPGNLRSLPHLLLQRATGTRAFLLALVLYLGFTSN